MLLRRHVVVVLSGLAIAGCSRQPPPPSIQIDSAKLVADTLRVRADRARIQGSPTARVWMLIASDFQCPYCRQFHAEAYGQVVKDYVKSGKIRVAFLNNPSSGHRHALIAAEAAMCAGAQDHFWEMHDKLFLTQGQWAPMDNPRAVYDSLANALRLDMNGWRACATTHTMVPLIEADHLRSQKGGVDATPSFFIGGKLAIVGVAPYADFQAALNAAIAQAGPPAGGGPNP